MEVNNLPAFGRWEKLSVRMGILGWIGAVFFQVFACQSEPEPTAILQISVLTEVDEIPAVEAKIQLYRSLQDWQHENNPINSAVLTNSLGNFIFSNLVFDTVFADIVSADKQQDNWESRIEVPLIKARFGYNNRFYSILKPSYSGRLSSAKGKKWKLTKVTLEHRDITSEYPACQADNTFTFYKNQKAIMHNMIKCQLSEADSIVGFWSANRQSTSLTMVLGNDTLVFRVKSLDNQVAVLEGKSNSQTVEFNFEAVNK